MPTANRISQARNGGIRRQGAEEGSLAVSSIVDEPKRNHCDSNKNNLSKIFFLFIANNFNKTLNIMKIEKKNSHRPSFSIGIFLFFMKKKLFFLIFLTIPFEIFIKYSSYCL